MGVVDRFHLELLLKQNGRQWNGVGAAVLLLLAMSGMFLWWPGLRNWTRGFKISFRSNWKRLNWDLHSAIGIWTVVFTLTWALTGVYFAWPQPFEAAIERVSSIPTARYPAEEMSRIAARPVASAAGPLDVQAVLQRAVQGSPNTHLEGLFLALDRSRSLPCTWRAARWAITQDRLLYFDQHTGALLYTWHRGGESHVGRHRGWADCTATLWHVVWLVREGTVGDRGAALPALDGGQAC